MACSSKKGRFASEKELRKKSPTLKDLDFLRLHDRGLRFSPEMYEKLVGTIERDVRVLESFKIMDYSLLVGIHKPGRGGQRGGVPAVVDSAHDGYLDLDVLKAVNRE